MLLWEIELLVRLVRRVAVSRVAECLILLILLRRIATMLVRIERRQLQIDLRVDLIIRGW